MRLVSGIHLPAMQISLGLNLYFPPFSPHLGNLWHLGREEGDQVCENLTWLFPSRAQRSLVAVLTVTVLLSCCTGDLRLTVLRVPLKCGRELHCIGWPTRQGCLPSDGHTLSTASPALWSCPHSLLQWHPGQEAAQFAQKSIPSPGDRECRLGHRFARVPPGPAASLTTAARPSEAITKPPIPI